MTNDLTAQHLEAIGKIQPYKKGSIESAATACAAITVEHIGKALVWAAKSEWKYQKPHGIWYNVPLELEATTDELVTIYFKSIQ